MGRLLVFGVTSAMTAALLVGCGGSDSGGSSSSGGTGGGSTGGAAGSGGATGGSGGTAGAAGAGGAAGSSGAAGAGGSTGGTGGSTGGSTGFWPSAYDAGCTPLVSKAHQDTVLGLNCLTCHSVGSTKPPEFIFAGVVWKTGGYQGAPKVEIGVKDGTNFLYACSDNQGKFWVAKTASNAVPDWPSAEIRIRNGNGEKTMQTKSVQAGTCNGCHDVKKLIQP